MAPECPRGSVRSVSSPSYFLGDPPLDPRFLASLGALSLVETLFTVLIYINNESGQVRRTCRWCTSYFLGDPPPDPRFLASLGVLSWAELTY
jgi:hypothetical protein